MVRGECAAGAWLRVKAILDTRTYHNGLTVEEAAMRDVQLRRHTLHPD